MAIKFDNTTIISDSEGWHSAFAVPYMKRIVETIPMPKSQGELVKVYGWEGSETSIEIQFKDVAESQLSTIRNRIQNLYDAAKVGALEVDNFATIPNVFFVGFEEHEQRRTAVLSGISISSTKTYLLTFTLNFRKVLK